MSYPDCASLLMNTDGVPLFKSSKVTIWPLYLVTNELPYSKCVANKNMIFAGFWFGEKSQPCGLSRTLTLCYACLFSFSVPVNFSLAFHNCKRNLIARSQNGDSSEIVRRHILLEWRYLLFSGDILLWFYTKESGIIT